MAHVYAHGRAYPFRALCSASPAVTHARPTLTTHSLARGRSSRQSASAFVTRSGENTERTSATITPKSVQHALSRCSDDGCDAFSEMVKGFQLSWSMGSWRK